MSISSWLSKYRVPYDEAESNGDDVSAHGVLPDGRRYVLSVGRTGAGSWRLSYGDRVMSGETLPKCARFVALSTLLCIAGQTEYHPELGVVRE